MAVRVRPSSRLISDDLPTLERPENATCGIPFVDSGCAWPICPMAPAKSTDLIRKRSTMVRGSEAPGCARHGTGEVRTRRRPAQGAHFKLGGGIDGSPNRRAGATCLAHAARRPKPHPPAACPWALTPFGHTVCDLRFRPRVNL